jgi:hypothetical protein
MPAVPDVAAQRQYRVTALYHELVNSEIAPSHDVRCAS